MSMHEKRQHADPGTDHGHTALSRRAWLGVAFGGAATMVLAKRVSNASGATLPALTDPAITIYASPNCQCCHRWAAYLEGNAFKVAVEKVSDVTPYKKKFAVPQALWSCHTAVLGRYVFEGHVPADLIEKVLIERPRILGLAVPGMPQGSPGMESDTPEKYDVIAFKADGQTEVYASR